MMTGVTDQVPLTRPPRSESRQVAELRALAVRQPELSDAVNLHLELLELERRILGRVSLPFIELSESIITQHAADGRPLLRFENIPLDLTDLRLMVRQIADVLRRYGALDDDDHRTVQSLGREMRLVAVAGDWYRGSAGQKVADHGQGADVPPTTDMGMLGQVLCQAMRPFLSRCAEVVQQRPELPLWTHSYCALCGGEPDFAVITTSAERHLICARCTLRWKFEPLTCPYCRNAERSRITSFATPDGQYRVYACDVCLRYLKAYDARRAQRPVMPIVDGVATLPLDAAAMQRGYRS
jgi:formate dehydrogenase maturation protein FdhE